MGAVVRRIIPADDAAVASIIRTVMPEFGASGPGFSIHDAEVSAMCGAYSSPGSAYFVLEINGWVLGGGGIAPLTGADKSVCELRKMYFLEAARGAGYGEQLLRRCLDFAKDAAYGTCYLETLTGMEPAQRLYERLGFERQSGALGATGHFACDRYYTRAL